MRTNSKETTKETPGRKSTFKFMNAVLYCVVGKNLYISKIILKKLPHTHIKCQNVSCVSLLAFFIFSLSSTTQIEEEFRARNLFFRFASTGRLKIIKRLYARSRKNPAVLDPFSNSLFFISFRIHFALVLIWFLLTKSFRKNPLKNSNLDLFYSFANIFTQVKDFVERNNFSFREYWNVDWEETKDIMVSDSSKKATTYLVVLKYPAIWNE